MPPKKKISEVKDSSIENQDEQVDLNDLVEIVSKQVKDVITKAKDEDEDVEELQSDLQKKLNLLKTEAKKLSKLSESEKSKVCDIQLSNF